MDETGSGDAGGTGSPGDGRGDGEGDGREAELLEDLAGEDEFYEFPDEDDDREPHTALPGRVEAWRRRSATGAILTGFALGLQEVFEPKRDEPAVIMETSGEPPKDLPVEADFEYGRPKQSVVNVRPWLLPGNPTGATGVTGPTGATGPAGSDGSEDGVNGDQSSDEEQA